MSSLKQFLEPIKVADKTIGNKYKAYKMDSSCEKNNMRKMVGLGTCHCCDYFLSKDGFVILIEETQLLKRVDKIRKEYDYLNDKDKNKAVNKGMLERMQLKAYGAMLVLCLLATKCSDAKALVQGKKYHFWLVASSIESEDEKKYFDGIKDDLNETLKQVLGKTLLDDVEIFSADTLKKRLLYNTSTP